MGFVFFFTSTLILSLLFTLSTPQPQRNTDAFYISSFFQTMGHRDLVLFDNICSFPRITCDSQMDGKVISLNASGLNLSGTIPDTTVGKLATLQSLDLSNNNISGLSADFWDIGTSLVSLNLSGNAIDGSVSNNIVNFVRLERLDLSNNRFSGEIPVGIGSLSSLKVLDLSANGFAGEIPPGIVGCQSLVWMDLSMNKLGGCSVFDGFGAGFKSLKGLNLAGNGFEGRMPDLSGLQSLRYLNLSANSFNGPIVGVLEQGGLEVIDLSSNRFQGYYSSSQPQVINSSSSGFNWSSSLTFLDLSGNELRIETFSGLRRAQSLNHLNLSRTRLVGQIPTEILNLSSLATLDLSHNHLTGEIPDVNVDNLQILDLSSNNLTGDIPASLQHQLLSLQRFNFSFNHLSICTVDQLPPQALNSSFIGSKFTCPIPAGNPGSGDKKRIKHHKGLKIVLAMALTCCFFLVTALFCIVVGFSFRKRSRSWPWAVKQLPRKEEANFSIPVIIFEKPLMNLTFTDLLTMTSNFDESTLLAVGRFGPVYRGVFPEGIQVAMKDFVCGSHLTEHQVSRGLEKLGRIKHPNLVPLIGYCLAGDRRIAIYKYMENGNLQDLLGEDNNNEEMTSWRFRYNIALGVARALAFLHHGCFPQIVHRDVKASTVYFDSNFEPKLAAFGLDYVVVQNDFNSGTALTTKSDVYGFGVILFELITGKELNLNEDLVGNNTSSVSWVRALVKNNQGFSAIDPKIRRSSGYSEKQMEEALRIAYLSTADLCSKRPSMQQIVGLLKDLQPIEGEL